MPKRSLAAVRAELVDLLATFAPDTGDRLPPERDLALRLGCSRDTLRKALAALEKDGEIWRHVGQGTFRGRRPRHLPVRDTLLVEGATPPDLMRARLVLEPRVAAEAALRADAADIGHLRAKVAAGRAARDRAACEEADDAFHRAVAGVTGNPVLVGFLAYLSGTRRRAAWQREWDRTYHRIGVGEFRALHSDQHERIVEAIAATDPVGAERAMKAHLETIAAAMTSWAR